MVWPFQDRLMDSGQSITERVVQEKNSANRWAEIIRGSSLLVSDTNGIA